MSGAQARGCSPIVTAYEGHTHNIKPVRPSTIAKSLAIGNPADGYYALQVMEESGGYGVASEDEDIVEGIKLLAESEGIFAETAGGVVISGLKKLALEGKIAPDEVTVAYITGSGLKTQEAIEDALELPLHIDPTMASFEAKLGERAASRESTAAV
jgi:threonine synthase